MILIGENIHVISKKVREALINRDEKFVENILNLQSKMDYADLNIGPARGDLSGIFSWLCSLIEENFNINISLDTTNFVEMKNAFSFIKNKKNVFLNSTSNDLPKLDLMCDLALENDCNLIALTMSKETGIPKTSDGRLEIAFEIYEKCLEKNLYTNKLFFDPLVIPITADQSQGLESLNTLKMIKESFDPPVKTIIGLSNISNGAPCELRPLINRVYAVLACGAGLDAIIMDAADEKLYRILKMLEHEKPQNETDKLYLRLFEMMANLSDLENIEYDKSDVEQVKIFKTCEIILCKKIYSDSFTQV